MITSDRQNSKKKQDGLALLVLVVVIFLAISSYYLSTISLVEVQVDKIVTTQVVLKRAKQALLDYAVINQHLRNAAGFIKAGQIAKLPCPDYISNLTEGEQDGNCGLAYANAIGYFPWRTLGLQRLKDSSGSCLLYAVSPAYKNSPAAALNPDSYGQFRVVNNAGLTVQGILPEDRPVVVIIAPGATLGGQIRESNAGVFCGSYYGDNIATLIAAYLDNDGLTDNAAIDPATGNIIENVVQKFAGSEETNNPLNDQLITITHRELWAAMQNAVESTAFTDQMENLTEALALCFAGFGGSNGDHLPMPVALDLYGNEYRKSNEYSDSVDFTQGYAGRLPYDVTQSHNELGNAADDDIIFENNYCNNLNLPSTAVAEVIRFADDAGSDQGAYFDLWSNWKDHFFYAISEDFNPDTAVVGCPGDCISINNSGTDYAGIVFFSGLKLPVLAQQRYTRPFDGALANKTVDLVNVDDKDDISNYLEDNNIGDFPVFSGNPVTATHPASDGARAFDLPLAGSNDIMYCINTDMSVVKCL